MSNFQTRISRSGGDSPPHWMRYYRDLQMGEIACATCGASVRNRGDLPMVHIDWHQGNGHELNEGGKG